MSREARVLRDIGLLASRLDVLFNALIQATHEHVVSVSSLAALHL